MKNKFYWCETGTSPPLVIHPRRVMSAVALLCPVPTGTKAICSQEGKVIDHPALIICMHLIFQSEVEI